jgi:hypothetical protein
MFTTDIEIRLVKIKHQIVAELMYHRKERLRTLLENVDFSKMSGMNKHQVLHEAIAQLSRMSPTDSLFLNRVEEQVSWVLNTYYRWFN